MISRMLATVLSGIAEFERDLISERPKSDRLAPKVMALISDGRSYRWIARDLGISKNTVGDIIKRFK